jgi:chromosome segregation ATPase
VDMNSLKKFKVEYTGIYKALVASHKNEQTYINECKSQINKIWESAQSVKHAIRMAANEVDKIEELKHRVEEEQTKVATKKEESEEKQAQIDELNADIAELNRKANEHHELDEDKKLKEL